MCIRRILLVDEGYSRDVPISLVYLVKLWFQGVSSLTPAPCQHETSTRQTAGNEGSDLTTGGVASCDGKKPPQTSTIASRQTRSGTKRACFGMFKVVCESPCGTMGRR